MTPYVFNQTVMYASYLQTQIGTLGLATSVDHIDTDTTNPQMVVTIWFPTPLSDGDQTTLTNYMSTYVDPVVTQNAINSILTALNTDENVIILARVRMQNVIPTMPVPMLLQICTMLGINPNS